MAQRISRVKQRVAGERFSMPSPDERPARLRSVLRVLYLMFNEGYTDLTRADLSDEAIRLARLVHAADDDTEVSGLLALMLLTDARRPARTDAAGTPVTLADQDRSRWDHDRIAEGTALLDAAIGRGAWLATGSSPGGDHRDPRPRGHRRRRRPQILALYELLERMTGSPVETLNRAVAAGMVDGPAAGLAILGGSRRVAPPPRPACGAVTCTSRRTTATGRSCTTGGPRAGPRTSRSGATSMQATRLRAQRNH